MYHSLLTIPSAKKLVRVIMLCKNIHDFTSNDATFDTSIEHVFGDITLMQKMSVL